MVILSSTRKDGLVECLIFLKKVGIEARIHNHLVYLHHLSDITLSFEKKSICISFIIAGSLLLVHKGMNNTH